MWSEEDGIEMGELGIRDGGVAELYQRCIVNKKLAFKAIQRHSKLSMKEQNPIVIKSKAFALHVVRIYQILSYQRHEYVLSRQLLRSGTSIGANIYESQCAQSRNDFRAKIYIAFKEAAETKYWLELLYESNYLKQDEYSQLQREIHEIYQILSSITKTVRSSSIPNP